MRVEVLYFDEGPKYRAAEETLRGLVAQEDAKAEVELVAVNSREEVQRLRFPGSPTIGVDGEELFAGRDRVRGSLPGPAHSRRHHILCSLLRIQEAGWPSRPHRLHHPRVVSVSLHGRRKSPTDSFLSRSLPPRPPLTPGVL